MSISQPNGDPIVVVLTPTVLETLRHAEFRQIHGTVTGLADELDRLGETTPWLAGFAETLLAAGANSPVAGSLVAVAPMESDLVRADLAVIHGRLDGRQDRRARDTLETLQLVLDDLDAVDALGWPDARS